MSFLNSPNLIGSQGKFLLGVNDLFVTAILKMKFMVMQSETLKAIRRFYSQFHISGLPEYII